MRTVIRFLVSVAIFPGLLLVLLLSNDILSLISALFFCALGGWCFGQFLHPKVDRLFDRIWPPRRDNDLDNPF